MKTIPIDEPQLGAPGAGLPKLELWVARWLFGRRRKRATREEATALFVTEHGRIQDLVRDLPQEVASRRVLIPRPRGLEDCSRYWSVYMVLDHLRIVNHGITETIRLLASGQTPGRVASTANVKPSVRALRIRSRGPQHRENIRPSMVRTPRFGRLAPPCGGPYEPPSGANHHHSGGPGYLIRHSSLGRAEKVKKRATII